MDENARKRKRDENEDEESLDVGDIDMEQPLKKSKKAIKETVKRQKSESSGSRIVARPDVEHVGEGIKSDAAENSAKNAKSETRQEKVQFKKSNQERKMAKREAKKARKELQPATVEDAMADVGPSHQTHEEDDDPRTGDMGEIDVPDIFDSPTERPVSTATPSPGPQSPTFDSCAVLSGSSSISSIAPPTQSKEPSSKEPLHEPKKPKIDPEELKARLQRRIEELRAARKADGLNGKPARNRQELLDARRRKEEQRKLHKKELRQKAKEEEQERQRLLVERGSPLLNSVYSSNAARSPSKGSDSTKTTTTTTNLTFGRVAFPGGHYASAQLSTILPSKTAKGPQDPFTALQGAQHKQNRLSGLDEEKRADIVEKDMWLQAHKHVLGERVRDDTSLLKKTLKRKESAKRKSEKEWTERIEGVEKAKAAKQRRREENLKKRLDEKGTKGKGKGKGKGKKSGKGRKQPKARPGFEGSFRTKAPRAVGAAAGAGAGGGDMRRR